MKNTLTLRTFISLVIFLTAGTLFAQTNFKSGYVIKLSGDTIFGEIDYRNDVRMAKKCSFRSNANAPVIDYKPEDIFGYHFTDSKYFVSEVVNGQRYFLEFLIKGKINIYDLKDDNGYRFFLKKDSSGIVEMPYEEGIRYRDNKAYMYESTKHMGILSYAMQDFPELKSRIEKIKKPEHKSLIKLAEDYHNAVCTDEKCIIYEKKMPAFTVNLEAVAGDAMYYYHYYSNNILKQPAFTTGLLAHIWMPMTSENLFFRTGFIYSNLNFNDKYLNFSYKIPLQIEYVYPKYIIRPKLAIGTNIYVVPFYGSIACMGGVNIEINKMLSWSINYDIDFSHSKYFPLIPSKLLSQALSTGLYIKF